MTVAALLAQLDSEARQRARTLENQGRLPHGFTEANYPLTRGEQRWGRRAYAYLRAADSPEAFVALMKGEPVPAHRIRPEYRGLL